MRTNKLLAGALVCLLSLTAVTSCGEKEPVVEAPTQQTADRLINRVHIDSSVYQLATQDFTLPTSVQDGDVSYPIKWTSDNEVNAKIVETTNPEGNEVKVKVVRPAYDATLEKGVPFTLTAELTTGEFKQTKEFKGVVVMMENAVKVADVNALWEETKKETFDINTVFDLTAYVMLVTRHGFWVMSDADDKPLLVNNSSFVESNGIVEGDNVSFKAKLEKKNFSYRVNKDGFSGNVNKKAKPLDFAFEKNQLTVEQLQELTKDEVEKQNLVGKQFNLTGKVLVEKDDKYENVYLETTAGKTRIKFDFGSSNAENYDKVKLLVGQTVTVDALYYYVYQNRDMTKKVHNLSLITVK